MGNEDDDRFLVICSDCGAAFAGQTVSSGEVQAIGCRNGCADCGSAAFAPVSAAVGEAEVEVTPSGD